MERLFPMNEEFNFSSFDMEFHKHNMNSASNQLQSCFSDPLDSALSSIVSSPATSNAGAGFNSGEDKLIITELIGRLGSICEAGVIPTPANITNISHYSTPFNSPPKLNLSMENPEMKIHSSFSESNFPIHSSSKRFSSGPEFSEIISRFSCFAGGKSSIQSRPSLPSKKSRKPSRGGSSLSCESAMKEEDEVEPTDRKRKLSSKVKSEENPAKIALIEGRNEEPDPDEASAMNDGTKTKTETNENQKNTKLAEPPKDYIHVRARRGQATDSHSLAERVRREKISERMKFLQDLVPGCDKVTGKAVMLDEIINYVQSLQLQVEFLSMKMASVTPRMNLNMEALLSKDIIHPINSSNGFLYENPQMQTIHLDGFSKDDQHVSSCWEDDLQSIVQMGFGQNQQQNLWC